MNFNEKKAHWAALALSAFLPLVGTWLSVVALGLAIYTATSSAPILGEATWAGAMHVSSSLWLLSVGATLSVGAARVSLLPLSLTILLAFLAYRAAKRAGIVSWEDVAIFTSSAAITTAFLSISSYEGTFYIAAIIGTSILFFLASILAWRSWFTPQGVVWHYVRQGWRYTQVFLVFLAATGFLLFLVGLIVGHGRVSAIYDAYVAGVGGNILLTLAQLFYLPDFIVWAVSIASGVPVSIGQGATFSAFHVAAMPLPGIPFFGALPTSSMTLYFLPVVIVAVGAISVWIVLRKRLEDVSFIEVGKEIAVALGLSFLILSVCGVLASGSLGRGRMLQVGMNAPLFAVVVVVELMVGVALTLGFVWLKYRRKSVQVVHGMQDDSVLDNEEPVSSEQSSESPHTPSEPTP